MYCIDFEVMGQPIGKGRPRFTRSGHTYTPEKTREYERRIRAAAWQRMQQLKVEPTLCHVHVDLVAYMQIEVVVKAKEVAGRMRCDQAEVARHR